MSDVYFLYAFFGVMALNIFATLVYFMGFRELRDSFRKIRR